MIRYILGDSPTAKASQARGLTDPRPSARCAKGHGHKGLGQIGDGAVTVTQPRIAHCFTACALAAGDTALAQPIVCI